MNRVAAILLAATMSLYAGAKTNEAGGLDQRGRDAIMRGDPEEAMEYFEKAIVLQPKNAELHYHLANACGQAAAAAGMFGAMSLARKAKAEWERAVQLDPNLLPARFALLEFHLIAPALFGGRGSEAIAQATEIRKRDPIEGHRAFARIHTAAKEPGLARKEYVDMVREQPASARAHYLFGVYLMLTEKDYDSARAELELALELDPTYMPAYFRIGHASALAAGDLARGEEALKRYLAYRPKDDEPSLARASYWLGAVYEKQGKKTEARSAYAASLKLNPNQKDVRAALRRVS
jgi:tetratricopeptide (TPR) repeat protein